MSSVETGRQLRVIDIRIGDYSSEELVKPETMLYCDDKPTPTTYTLEHRFKSRRGRKSVVRVTDVPAWECKEHDIVTVDLRGSAAALEVTIPIVQRARDREVTRQLQASLSAAYQQIARLQVSGRNG